MPERHYFQFNLYTTTMDTFLSRRAVLLLGVMLLLQIVLLQALPRHRRPTHDFQEADQQAAASGGHHGRVQIKVYRGPDHDHHAPYGYWVKQPADDGPHGSN